MNTIEVKKIDELINRPINRITITWYSIFYIFYILCVWYFLFKAVLNTYSPVLAGLVWLITVLSYVFSIFLIRRE